MDTHRAFARYEAVRAGLPAADFPAAAEPVPDLSALADRFDAFVLDAFGVLNVGETVIPGAIARMAELRAQGKRLVVLTNAATHPRDAALAKYRRLGFDFAPAEVIASRDLAATALATRPRGFRWAAITAPGAGLDDIDADVTPLDADPGLIDRADGFLFLGSDRWTPARQAALIAALAARPRPLVVANPDIVAPREDGFTLEPGHFAHEIAAATGIVPEFHGKPFACAFAAARAALGRDLPAHRIAVVGDTLHTDVLGGRAAGLGTVLVTGHGLFRGYDPAQFVAASGIVPDFVAPTT